MDEITKRIVEVLNSSASGALSAYTQYFIWDSVVWCAVGILFLLIGWRVKVVFDQKAKSEDEVGFFVAGWIVVSVAGFIGLMILASNLSDLVAPKAAAIHQLIKDIRDGK